MINILSWLALIFLTLAGYSAGGVLGSRTGSDRHKGDPSPSVLDTAMVVVLWLGGIASRLKGMNLWPAIGIWVVVALVVAFVLNKVQGQPDESKPLPQ